MKTGAARLARLGGVFVVLAIVGAATTGGLTWLGWLPNLGWYVEQPDSLVAETEGKLRKIEPDTNMIHIGSTPSGPGAAAFVVTADTRLVIENEEARFADLREGMHVKVVYERRDDTRLAWSVEASTAQDARNADAAAAQPSATPSGAPATPSAAPVTPSGAPATPSTAPVTPSAAPVVPDSRPGAVDAVSSQPQATEPSRGAGPTPPIQAPSPSPPPKPSAGVGTPPGSRAEPSTPTRVAAPGRHPKPSVERDASSGGRRAANAPVREVAPPARSDEPERFDPSAVVDWVLKDRGQTLPDVGRQ